jgi:polyisoprenoid-binding protein YceI
MTTVPEAGRYVLDPAKSSVAFSQKGMWGLVTVKGTFATATGDGEVLPDGTATGVIRVDASSIDTKQTKRDTHMRSAEFFDVEQFPLIQFDVSSASRDANGTASVDGRLTVRGVTQPQAATVTVAAVEPDAVTLTTEFPVDRTVFGLNWNQLGMIRGAATVTATLHFTRTAA